MKKNYVIPVFLGAAVVGLCWLASDQLFAGRRPDSMIMPGIVFVAPEALESRTCPENTRCLPAKAFFVPAEHRIYLRKDWSADNFDDLAILLHEFVHHLQTMGKLRYPCDTEIELPAYALQEAFYKAHQRSPERHVPSDFTRFSRYSCIVQE